MRSSVIGVSALATGLILWINHNLGILFWVLLVITLLDFLLNAVMDLTKQEHEKVAWQKSIRSFGVLGIPVLLANFAHGLTTVSITSALQVVFAILILIQLMTVVPNLLNFIKFMSTKVFGNSPAVKEIDAAAQSELLKLIQDLDAKINQAGVSGIGTNQTITSAENSVKTAMNQNEGK